MDYKAAMLAMSVLAILLNIPPYIFHIVNKNVATIILITWTLLMCIKTFIDAIIWSNEDFVTNSWNGAVYCDIAVRLKLAYQAGIFCAVTAIMRQVFLVMKNPTAFAEKSPARRLTEDLLICLVTPVYLMIISFINMPVRYMIFRYSGCEIALAATWVALFTVGVVPVVWSAIAIVYSILAVIQVIKRKNTLKDFLHCVDSGFSVSRLVRVIIFCFAVIGTAGTLSIYMFVESVEALDEGMIPWSSSIIYKYANLIMKIDQPPLLERWIFFAVGYLTFIFLGTGSDSLRMYGDWLRRMGMGQTVDYLGERKAVFDAKVSEVLRKTVSRKERMNDDIDLENGSIETQSVGSLTAKFHYHTYTIDRSDDEKSMTSLQSPE